MIHQPGLVQQAKWWLTRQVDSVSSHPKKTDINYVKGSYDERESGKQLHAFLS
jgi:hypothetical protein